MFSYVKGSLYTAAHPLTSMKDALGEELKDTIQEQMSIIIPIIR